MADGRVPHVLDEERVDLVDLILHQDCVVETVAQHRVGHRYQNFVRPAVAQRFFVEVGHLTIDSRNVNAVRKLTLQLLIALELARL